MKWIEALRAFEAGLQESLELVRNQIAELEAGSRTADAGEQHIDDVDDAAEPPVTAEVQRQTPFRPFYR